jgi:AraC-like DNA-binding protein
MISPGFIADALQCMVRRGVDPYTILTETGIPHPPTEPVTNMVYGRLWWRIAEVVQDEFFELGERPMRPGSFEMLCWCTLHTADLEEALERALAFLGLVLDEPRGRLVVTGGEARIILDSPSAARSAFAYRTYWLILMGVVCWLVGRRIALTRLGFACDEPDERDDYRKFFGAPVVFNAPETFLVFNAANLSLPVIRDEAALRHFVREAPGNILIRYRHDQGYTSLIRRKLDTLRPNDWPKFEDMAHMLNIAPATLRRRLKVEGQSYARLKDDIRSALARRMLEDGRLSITEVASELGYSEPSAFYRAYGKWSGDSPRGRRRAQCSSPQQGMIDQNAHEE